MAGEVAMVARVVCPASTESGLKDIDAAEGRPVAVSVTWPGVPETTVVRTVIPSAARPELFRTGRRFASVRVLRAVV